MLESSPDSLERVRCVTMFDADSLKLFSHSWFLVCAGVSGVAASAKRCPTSRSRSSRKLFPATSSRASSTTIRTSAVVQGSSGVNDHDVSSSPGCGVPSTAVRHQRRRGWHRPGDGGRTAGQRRFSTPRVSQVEAVAISTARRWAVPSGRRLRGSASRTTAVPTSRRPRPALVDRQRVAFAVTKRRAEVEVGGNAPLDAARVDQDREARPVRVP